MKLRSIPLEKVKVPETRVTAVYNEETAELLKKTIEKLGIVEPPIFTQVGEFYEVVDGKHRVDEAREHGETHIKGIVYEGDSKSSLLMNLVLNKVRGKTKASEMVQVIRELTQGYGMDSVQIENETGLPRDYVEKLWKIAEASPTVQQALDDETIGVGAAYEISRLPSFAQQDEVVARQQIYKLPVKELKSLVDNVIKEMENLSADQEPPPPPAPREYHCEGCKQVVDPRYLRPVLVCPNCFGHVWRLAKSAESDQAQGVAPAKE